MAEKQLPRSFASVEHRHLKSLWTASSPSRAAVREIFQPLFIDNDMLSSITRSVAIVYQSLPARPRLCRQGFETRPKSFKYL
jgi:hypothetical protein